MKSFHRELIRSNKTKVQRFFRLVPILVLLVTSCRAAGAFNGYPDIGLSPEITYTSTVLAYDAAGNESKQSTLGFATTQAASSVLPVFPGAEGFGTTTPAGSGRHISQANTTVYKVTNLGASGSGSLRDCIDASGPRVCVFEVSGTIEINDSLSIRNPYITIAGQTAPSPGITLKGAKLLINTHDVLIQHLRIRVGDGPGYDPDNRDGIEIENDGGVHDVYNVVVDHCSVSWAIDENTSLWYDGVRDVTISNCIISEALYDSLHSKGPHSMGLLIGEHVKRVSMHHSLLAHNLDRNPLIQADTETELVNNVYYNCGSWGFMVFSDDYILGIPLFSNVVGNYYKRGIDGPDGKPIQVESNLTHTSKVYVEGNIGPGRQSDTEDDWSIVTGNEAIYRSFTPVVTQTVLITNSAWEAYVFVLNHAGARPADRDSVDIRILNDVRNGTGRIIDSQDEVGGWPNLPQNYRVLTLPSNPNSDDDGDGYTNLEEWLHAFAAEVEGYGFTLNAIPSVRAIATGGVATYTVSIEPVGGFTATVTLSAASPSPSLSLSLHPTTVAPLDQATLTVTDTHTGMLLPGLWYTVPITAIGGGFTQTASLRLLVGGVRVYLPLLMR
jgi:hypothetical protein